MIQGVAWLLWRLLWRPRQALDHGCSTIDSSELDIPSYLCGAQLADQSGCQYGCPSPTEHDRDGDEPEVGAGQAAHAEREECHGGCRAVPREPSFFAGGGPPGEDDEGRRKREHADRERGTVHVAVPADHLGAAGRG